MIEYMLPLLQEIFTLFLGLIIESFPFIIIGVSISTIIGLVVKESWVIKHIPKNRFVSHSMMGLLGIFLPVCECGNVPLARRLIVSKFSVSQAITFLLAAPIVNPITFITTLEAFNLTKEIAFIRIICGFLIAVTIGLIFSYVKNQNTLITKQYNHTLTCHSTHEKNIFYALGTFQREFFEVFKMLFVGAIIAALTQALIPREVMASVGTHPILSILAMIAIGFIISICSNIDAFFALSYSATFTIGSLMSFMLFGPMIDIKILSMLRTTFTKKTLMQITLLVTISAIIIGLLMNIYYV